MRAAREWPSTAGKVVVSKAELRKVKVIDSDRAEGHRFEERNFADIVYEYSVAGRKLRNNRVSIGEDRGNFQVAETIAKYPVGAVVTVYYNPLHPDQAVLERDLPKGMWGCLGIGTAIVLAIVFGSAIGLHQLTEFASTHLANSAKCRRLSSPSSAFGFLIALFALALHRQASLAMKWPVVSGTIKSSDIEQFMSAPSGAHRARPAHVSAPGVLHLSLQRHRLCQRAREPRRQRRVDVELAGAHIPENIPDGATVKVWVNPHNPSEATLEPRASHVWVSGCRSRRSGAWRITRRCTASFVGWAKARHAVPTISIR